MKSAKITVICILTSALVFASAYQAEKVYAKQPSSSNTVKVGIYYSIPGKDTSIYSCANISHSGFEIGYSDSKKFIKLFEFDNNKIIVAPSGNFCAKSWESDMLYPGSMGEIVFGGYHLQLSEIYKTYSAAKAAAENNPNAFVAYSNGKYFIRIGSFVSYEDAEIEKENHSGSQVVSPSGNGITLCDLEVQKILFEYDDDINSFALQARNNGTVTLPNSYSYFGFFEYLVNNKKLNMINCIELEQYVKCVMANEIGTNASEEVTKAFSILVRTVPLTSKHAEYGFDVCNSSCCQVYKGNYRESPINDAIVDSTKGKILTYDGSPIYCLYNYSNGGASCSSAAAWGSNTLPYLTSVFQEEPEGSGFVWQKVFNKDELFKYLKTRNTFSTLRSEIENVEITATDPYGSEYVTAFAVSDINGNTVTVYNSAEIRGILEFYSSNFKVHYSFNTPVTDVDANSEKEYVTSIITAKGVEEIDSFGKTYDVITANGISKSIKSDLIVFDGKGKGHGVGFSQVGAEALISEGYDYAYTLSFYFPGTVLTNIND
ncbi:MAG: hypothetical protein A2Y15_07160 [Clostridiales bacterium GWF2_36_10]|nr:MAG: hypothetical protein A2Y15_07160 [Clostridiales bacterium GWF2_36_10]HAN21336.1 hypothetical protein [Clostridiales bacterium]